MAAALTCQHAGSASLAVSPQEGRSGALPARPAAQAELHCRHLHLGQPVQVRKHCVYLRLIVENGCTLKADRSCCSNVVALLCDVQGAA
jgi:hypothetical protein